MHPSPGYATARFVAFGSGRVARVAPNRQQIAVPSSRALINDLRRHQQERICRAMWIAPSRACTGLVSGAGELCATVAVSLVRRVRN